MTREIKCENATRKMKERSGFFDNVRKGFQIPKELEDFSELVVEDFRDRDDDISRAVEKSNESLDISKQAVDRANESVTKEEFEEYKNMRDYVDEKLSDKEDKDISKEAIGISKRQYWTTVILFFIGLVATYVLGKIT